MDLPAQTCIYQAKREIASFPDYPTQPGDEASSLYSLNCFLILVNTHTVVTVVLGPEDKICITQIAQIVLKIANPGLDCGILLQLSDTRITTTLR